MTGWQVVESRPAANGEQASGYGRDMLEGGMI
jgi:hypothetical protein